MLESKLYLLFIKLGSILVYKYFTNIISKKFLIAMGSIVDVTPIKFISTEQFKITSCEKNVHVGCS